MDNMVYVSLLFFSAVGGICDLHVLQKREARKFQMIQEFSVSLVLKNRSQFVKMINGAPVFCFKKL